MKKKIVSGLLTMTMLAGLLSGCGASGSKSGSDKSEIKVTANEPMMAGSKWINSTIEGAIDDTTDISVKDDFYTAVNKDWLLSTEIDEITAPEVMRVFSQNKDLVEERILKIVSGEEDPDAGQNKEVPTENYGRAVELIQTFASAVNDWDHRDAVGVSVLQKYIDYINAMESDEDLQNYFLDTDQQNLFGIGLMGLSVSRSRKDMLAGEDDPKDYYVTVSNDADFSMDFVGGSVSDVTSMYTGSISNGILLETLMVQDMEAALFPTLTKMGYTETEAKNLLTKCFQFECRIVDHIGSLEYYQRQWEGTEPITRDDLAAMEGNYPLTALLDAYGYDSDEIIVVNPSYVKYIGTLVTEANLDEIKAYLIVNTVMNARNLLDSETYAAANAESDEKSDDSTAGSSLDYNAILTETLCKYLGSCVDLVYVSRYTTEEAKDDVTSLIYEIIDVYHDLLNGTDWLSDETKENAIAKLEGMSVHAMYSDTFDDFEYLDFGDDTELLDMVADIAQQLRGTDAYLIGTKSDGSAWVSSYGSTTTVNCFYDMSNNSINILAGFADGAVYQVDMSYEEKLALLGTTIGHEISHGFDDKGATWDKDGRYNDWWTLLDKTTFKTRVMLLQNYYSTITPYQGGQYLIGANLSGEAIADMAGVKSVLLLAEKQDDFDYEKFFESYATLFANKSTLDTEANSASSDEHPIACLRSNVTLSQFDKFLETYDIQPGDGMYVEPEKRISVW